jgi:hypothetical protein
LNNNGSVFFQYCTGMIIIERIHVYNTLKEQQGRSDGSNEIVSWAHGLMGSVSALFCTAMCA